jgi:ABC-2 type transport system permease protein
MIDPSTAAHATVAEDPLRSVLSSRERPERPNALSTSLTFGWRALLKIKHIPEQLFDAVGNPVIFTLLFTYLLGGAIAGSTDAYLQFLIPGILVQTVILITAYTGVNLNTDISKGVADRFRSLPIWRPSVVVGALLGDACWGWCWASDPGEACSGYCCRWRCSSCSRSASHGSGRPSGWC